MTDNSNSYLSLPPEANLYYIDHAYDFVCDYILVDVWDKYKPSKQQKEVMDAYDKYPRILIDSGHSTGKSNVMAWLGIHFLATRPSGEGEECKVPCTAPTGHQLKDVLWANFSKWIGLSRLRGDLEWMATEIRHKLMPHPHYAIARTSNKADNMQGQHAKHLLWLVDEGYGILTSGIWEVINGSLSQGADNKIIIAGQPTQVTGYCADIKNPKRSPEWKEPNGKCIRLNSEEAPEEICNKSWVLDMEKKWTRTHDVFRVRVLGLPPLGNPKAFMSLSEVAAAIAREVPEQGEFEIAIDPAREGDDLCAMAVRRGFYYFPLDRMGKSDEIEIAAMALRKVREIREKYKYNTRIKVKIENIGGYGSGAIDILRRNKKDNIEVVPITSGGSGDEEYANGISVAWAEFKSNLDKIHLPDDDDLMGQLCARESTIDLKSGRMMIEPKRIYKARMGHSPDLADAIIMCWTKRATKTRMIEADIAGCTTKISVKWEGLGPGTTPMIGLYTDKDTKTGTVVALWKQDTGTLYAVFGRDYESGRPEAIIPDILSSMGRISNGVVQNLRSFEWFGNKVYDQIGLGSPRDAWAKHNTNVRANTVFNIDGAILAINRMLGRKAIVFDETWAGQLAVDMQAWFGDDKEAISNSVLALAEIVSVINDGTYISRQTPIPAFSPERIEAKKRNEEAMRLGNRHSPQIADSDSWMA